MGDVTYKEQLDLVCAFIWDSLYVCVVAFAQIRIPLLWTGKTRLKSTGELMLKSADMAAVQQSAVRPHHSQIDSGIFTENPAKMPPRFVDTDRLGRIILQWQLWLI